MKLEILQGRPDGLLVFQTNTNKFFKANPGIEVKHIDVLNCEKVFLIFVFYEEA